LRFSAQVKEGGEEARRVSRHGRGPILILLSRGKRGDDATENGKEVSRLGEQEKRRTKDKCESSPSEKEAYKITGGAPIGKKGSTTTRVAIHEKTGGKGSPQKKKTPVFSIERSMGYSNSEGGKATLMVARGSERGFSTGPGKKGDNGGGHQKKNLNRMTQ